MVDRAIAVVRRHIDDKDFAGIREDIIHAPAWIGERQRPLKEVNPAILNRIPEILKVVFGFSRKSAPPMVGRFTPPCLPKLIE